MIKKREHGFTLIELFVLFVIVGILVTLVAMTYGGVQAKNRNDERQTDVDMLKGHLEGYYAQQTKYPTLTNLNDPAFRAAALKDLKPESLQDPLWTTEDTACLANGKVVVSAEPAQKCYTYQVRSSDGSACDNVTIDCSQYTLTALLEGGEKYVKSSLN
jgi:type II secretory pathway pseudopilin PulG